MEIKPPNIQIPTTLAREIKPAVEQWRTGQILQATLVAKPKSDSFTIKIGSTTLQATGTPTQQQAAAIEVGAKLQLQVVQVKPQVTLKVMPPPNPASGTAEAMKQHLPKQAPLPPLLANLAALTKPQAQPTPLPLPPDLIANIKNLVKQLPTAQTMLKGNGDSIKQAIKDSGLFMEQTLTNATTAQTKSNVLDHDFKANMLRILEQLKNYQQQSKETTRTQTPAQTKEAPSQTHQTQQHQNLLQNKPTKSPQPQQPQTPLLATQPITSTTPGKPDQPLQSGIPIQNKEFTTSSPPPLKHSPVHAQNRSQPSLAQNMPLNFLIDELGKQIEGALSRIRVTQLANVPSDTTQPLNWNIELPIRREAGIDVISLRIEEDDSQGSNQEQGKQKAWKVTLAFDFDELGPIYANLTIHEKSVGASLHAEQDKTTKLINQHIDELSKSLIDAGLTVDKLSVHQGKPSTSGKTRIFQSLLDIKA